VTALLSAELLKLRTTRTFVALTSVAITISLLVSLGFAIFTDPTEESVLTDVFLSDTSSLFIMILAVVGITGEWRHRTITSSLLAAPDRLRFLTAKTLAFAAAGALLSLLITISISIVGLLVLTLLDDPTPSIGDLLDLLWRNVLIAALLGAFGVGIGAVVRNQIVAIVGLLVWAFAVEPLLFGLVPEVGRLAPINGLPTALLGFDEEALDLPEEFELLSFGGALGLLLIWIAVAFAIGAWLLRRRDLT
jgi:ABC-2 type transport system permease protein